MSDASEDNKKSGMTQVTLMKWLLTSSSHLGRALAELFGLLVNQCIGSDHTSRLRRHAQNANQSAVPTVKSRAIATLLTKLLMKGLSWKCPDTIKVPRLRYFKLFLNAFANIFKVVPQFWKKISHFIQIIPQIFSIRASKAS